MLLWVYRAQQISMNSAKGLIQPDFLPCCIDSEYDVLVLQAARVAKEKCETLDVQVFSDRDIDSQRDRIETALESADVFFGSLLFDYDQVLATSAKF